mmetsp:Transcript_27934/g.41244  ORF Transcript_27934/g.41244 Transcript_27934/m.41244 type:complete len:204 (+) Transcript_27934:1129-1740(+)
MSPCQTVFLVVLPTQIDLTRFTTIVVIQGMHGMYPPLCYVAKFTSSGSFHYGHYLIVISGNRFSHCLTGPTKKIFALITRESIAFTMNCHLALGTLNEHKICVTIFVLTNITNFTGRSAPATSGFFNRLLLDLGNISSLIRSRLGILLFTFVKAQGSFQLRRIKIFLIIVVISNHIQLMFRIEFYDSPKEDASFTKSFGNTTI